MLRFISTKNKNYIFLNLHIDKSLRRILEHKRNDNEEWKELHNEELHNLYRSHNIVIVTKSIGLRWIEHVARMEEDECFENFDR